MKNLIEDERVIFESLDRAECLQMLGWESIGRLATCADGEAPEVVPVNFTLDGDVIVIRCDARRAAHLRSRPASFQIDRFDEFQNVGWSVLVSGWLISGKRMTPTDKDVSPWAPGDRHVMLQLEPTRMTGRRIAPAPRYVSNAGYL
jgi:nitroimidazol reductase NimA-like FMN-containing flavoprotein (pyridoxamine 5'-phosphate oxidase superfamily)